MPTVLLVVDGKDWLHPVFYRRYFEMDLSVLNIRKRRPPIESTLFCVRLLIIPGSMARIVDQTPETRYLLELIRTAHRRNIGMIGICHGHQAINLALGGRLERLPDWNQGVRLSLHGGLSGLKSHSIKVVESPFTVRMRRDDEIETCYQADPFVFTTQYHFEISPFAHPGLYHEAVGQYLAWGYTRKEIEQVMSQSDESKLHRFRTSIAVRTWLLSAVRQTLSHPNRS